MLKRICVPLVLLVAASVHAQSFGALMTGSQEVPAVQTPGLGVAGISVMSLPDGTLAFKGAIMATRLTGLPIAYHVHAAAPGANGPIVIDLVGSETRRFVLGRTVFLTFEGTVADPNGDILAAMVAGMTYVNVHTAAHPGGEIRGQLYPRAR